MGGEFIDEEKATRDHVDALRKEIVDAIDRYNILHAPIATGEVVSALVEALVHAWDRSGKSLVDFPRFLREQATDIERQLAAQGFQTKT